MNQIEEGEKSCNRLASPVLRVTTACSFLILLFCTQKPVTSVAKQLIRRTQREERRGTNQSREMETKLVNEDDDDVNGPPAAAPVPDSSSSSPSHAPAVTAGDNSRHCSQAPRRPPAPSLLRHLHRSSERKLSKDTGIACTAPLSPLTSTPFAYLRRANPAALDTGRKSGAGTDLRCMVIYGWRKRFLYFSILVAMGLIAINAALTFYLFALLRVSITDGTIGPIVMSENGIEVMGHATFRGNLSVGVIRSRNGRSLRLITESGNVSITDAESNKLTISSDGVEVTANSFHVHDSNHKLVFALEDGKLKITQDRLVIERKNSCPWNQKKCFSYYCSRSPP